MIATAVRDAISATALDYLGGWFDGDAVRIERALHPELCKRALRSDGSVVVTSAQEMIEATGRGTGRAQRPADPAIQVRIDDVYEHLANATVFSAVYREYLQLVRTQDGWKILNTLYSRMV